MPDSVDNANRKPIADAALGLVIPPTVADDSSVLVLQEPTSAATPLRVAAIV